MELAWDASQRGWWDDYADKLNADYREYIGLDRGAASIRQYLREVIPGLLRTPDYVHAQRADLPFLDFFPCRRAIPHPCLGRGTTH
jgi:hypothetical protein